MSTPDPRRHQHGDVVTSSTARQPTDAAAGSCSPPARGTPDSPASRAADGARATTLEVEDVPPRPPSVTPGPQVTLKAAAAPPEDSPRTLEAPVATSNTAQDSQPRTPSKAGRWLDRDAWQMFSNQESMRLAGWGLTKQHRGSCVLVSDL